MISAMKSRNAGTPMAASSASEPRSLRPRGRSLSRLIRSAVPLAWMPTG